VTSQTDEWRIPFPCSGTGYIGFDWKGGYTGQRAMSEIARSGEREFSLTLTTSTAEAA
jgi:hypothetical protein